MDLHAVDVPWIIAWLQEYLEKTETIEVEAGDEWETVPACGSDEALRRTEGVHMILDHLFPDWRSEPVWGGYGQYHAERCAARQLIGRLQFQDEIHNHLGVGNAPAASADEMHELVWQAARAQWSTGHMHEAVLAAAKAVNSQLQEKIGRRDVAETALVQEAFSKNDPAPGKPRLRFDEIKSDTTRDSMRQGAMQFGTGCFEAIRNPVGHLPNEEVDLPEQIALEELAALSLLARWIERADVVTVSGPSADS